MWSCKCLATDIPTNSEQVFRTQWGGRLGSREGISSLEFWERREGFLKRVCKVLQINVPTLSAGLNGKQCTAGRFAGQGQGADVRPECRCCGRTWGRRHPGGYCGRRTLWTEGTAGFQKTFHPTTEPWVVCRVPRSNVVWVTMSRKYSLCIVSRIQWKIRSLGGGDRLL